MFKRLVKWHQDWENEGLMVLQNPAVAETLPPGLRRTMARKMAAMSPFERQQLHEFSTRYLGWRAYAAIGKMMLACTIGAILFHLVFPRFHLGMVILCANVAGICFMSMFVTSWYNFRWISEHKTRLMLIMFTMAALGNLTGATVAAITKGKSLLPVLERLPPVILATLAGVALMMVPFALVAIIRNQHYQAWMTRLQDEAEREKSARELSESKLRMLRAQIEPHFLFNTLGAVQQLAEQGAPRAAALTAHLIAFLRASLTGMRSETISLRDDFALVAAYLEVMQTRMGTRLRFRLELPPALADVSVPSMMLLTLVENAIKHGIEPSLRGGEVCVTALQDGQALRLDVQDSGVGLSDSPGHGDGLDNIRSRLKLAYGEAGVLRLDDAPDGGAVASITLPLPSKDPA
jgi:sensor histidine kinase YesM